MIEVIGAHFQVSTHVSAAPDHRRRPGYGGAAVAGTPDSSAELLDQVWATEMRAGQSHVAIADAGGSPSRRRQTCSAPQKRTDRRKEGR